jgi:tRNA nucleotidyltransferase/poly(A) polymerase
MLRDELVRRFPRLMLLPPDSYVVGGAVRDLLLGIDPADVDVACGDPLSCARWISKKPIRLGTGEHLSAWRVVDGEHVYDFAELLDHDIDADLARRDFTIDAMAVRLGDGELLDPHSGRRDLERRCVRMIAPENFDDDPLRCLKAVRMAVVRRFEVDPETIAAIRPRASQITEIAAERVTFELSLIFGAGRFRRAIELLRATALDVPLFGRELGGFHSDDVSVAGAYALLVEDPKLSAKRWRWSSDLLHEVVALKQLLRKSDVVALYDAGETVATQLPAVLRALGRDDRVTMPDFSIQALLRGEEIGLPEGPQLGRVKRALLEAQVRGEVQTIDEARAFVKAESRRQKAES